jgi:guanylate kinase/SAM-dependent methyltransferase
MSILYYIKDPIPFLMIGGQSGVGKTSIIDYLVTSIPNHFQVPLSYTTREKRDKSDRYTFISTEEIIGMHDKKELLNLDYVHGAYYGIAKRELTKIKKTNKIPIKEIHPSNFYKFSNKGTDAIRILIENKHLSNFSNPFLERENRVEDDFDFENFKDYDIRVNICGLTIEDAATCLIKRILAWYIHLSSFPNPLEIEKINQIGYSKIATEFTDKLRVTTKNFHDVSIPFWNKNLYKLNTDDLKYNILELGPGNGWLFENIKPYNHRIFGLEITDEMRPKYCEEVFITSSRNIPIKANFFDFVVGSLADPLISPEAFIEIERILKPGGELIITLPAVEWAKNLDMRTDINKTTFYLSSGEQATVFSFCDALRIHSSVSLISKLKLVESEPLFINVDYSDPISKAITDSQFKSGKDLWEFPIVIGMKFIKGDE